MRLRYVFWLVPGLALLLSGCSRCSGGKDPHGSLEVPDSVLNVGVQVASSAIDEMVENISSPVETAALIKRLKVPFNKDLLIPTDAVKHFNTNFQKALGLGLYGTDLGYLNMYEKTSEVLSYISAVKELADGIQVGQFFDFGNLKRLATNNESLDSLIYISQESYNKIDEYLRRTNRSSLSIVIMSGVWVEGMYLASRIAKETQNEQMIETVADQKIVIATLIPMLKVYEKDSNIEGLVKEFEKLKVLYDDVKITYERAEPVSRIENGQMVFEQKDKQIVEASPELMNSIMDSIIGLRNKMISANQ